MPEVTVIINPISGPKRRGRGDARAELARHTLERLGVDGDVRLTERGGHAHELALEATAAGVSTVIAWGGDGTINEVGRALVQRALEGTGNALSAQAPPPALGLVPGGSGNGLSRELRIPFDPRRALERALSAPVRQVDVGELGGHVFLNIAGIGLDAHVAALVSTRVHHRGLVPYVTASLGDLLNFRPSDYAIEIHGTVLEMPALLVAVANSPQYGFGARIAPAASMTDGLLDLVAVSDRKLLGNLTRLPSLFVGRVDQQPGVKIEQIRTATIRCKTPMLFHVDGEAVQGSDTLIAHVHPGALRLRA